MKSARAYLQVKARNSSLNTVLNKNIVKYFVQRKLCR